MGWPQSIHDRHRRNFAEAVRRVHEYLDEHPGYAKRAELADALNLAHETIDGVLANEKVFRRLKPGIYERIGDPR